MNFKDHGTRILILSVVALSAFVGICLNAPKVSREASEPMKATVMLVEANHHPSTTVSKLGYHRGIDGKMIYGPHLGVEDEVNLITFLVLESEERLSSSDRLLAMKLSGVTNGTLMKISYRKLFRVKSKGKTTISRKYMGVEVLEVERM